MKYFWQGFLSVPKSIFGMKYFYRPLFNILKEFVIDRIITLIQQEKTEYNSGKIKGYEEVLHLIKELEK